jgi:hypothetical protein
VILNEKFYSKIINHKNYTPRIIEFITDNSRISTLNGVQYQQFILNNLNNPKEIWRYSYLNQIDYLDRCLVLTLFSFGYYEFEDALMNAYEGRLNYEKEEHNQIFESSQFNKSMKILLNGFLSVRISDIKNMTRSFTFINPSLIDFLIGYINESYQDKKSIIQSAIYFEQLNRFDPEESKIPLEKDLQKIIRNKISKSEMILLGRRARDVDYTINDKKAKTIETLCKYCYDVNIDTILLQYFKELDFSITSDYFYNRIIFVLLKLDDAPQTYNFIKENFKLILNNIFEQIDDVRGAKNIRVLFEKYEQDYQLYIDTEEGQENIMSLVESILKSTEYYMLKERMRNIENLNAAKEIYDELDEISSELQSELLPNTTAFYNFGIAFNELFWKDQIEDNLLRIEKELGDSDDYADYYDEGAEKSFDEQSAIEDLFFKNN